MIACVHCAFCCSMLTGLTVLRIRICFLIPPCAILQHIQSTSCFFRTYIYLSAMISLFSSMMTRMRLCMLRLLPSEIPLNSHMFLHFVCNSNVWHTQFSSTYCIVVVGPVQVTGVLSVHRYPHATPNGTIHYPQDTSITNKNKLWVGEIYV